MSIKITIPNSSSDVLTFGSGNTPTAAQIAGIDSGSSNGQLALYTTASGTSTERVRVDASGNVGIGTASPTQKLEVSGSGGVSLRVTSTNNSAQLILNSSGTNVGYINYNIGGAGALAFYDSNAAAERMRIDSSGNLLVGATSTSGNTGRIASRGNASGFDTYQGYNNGGTFTFAVSAGGTVFAVSTTISSISDIRFKENIRDLNVGLAEVMTLKPRLYDWKEGKGADIKNARGFIAQEFEEVFPDLIDEWKDPAPEGEEPYKSVRADLIPVLVKAIQEQQAIITSLTDRITALENK
jgi:carbon monoxide dehydrogenase subunit G